MNTERKGILLAGGRGTRLYPLTASTSKQLVAVYNKPMIYYSISLMMLAGITEFAIISTPEHLPAYRELLGDGSCFGINLTYIDQKEPRGVAEAFLVGEDFLDDHPSMLVLGDNLFYGPLDFLREAVANEGDEATIFAYEVATPSLYGVVHFDRDWRVADLEEKPVSPSSNWAIPGMYLYPPGVTKEAQQLVPSLRGELEITDLNKRYLNLGRLKAIPMGRGVAWFDIGTPSSLLKAGNFIEALERRQGLLIGSPEEIALSQGLISKQDLASHIGGMPASDYRSYLEDLVR